MQYQLLPPRSLAGSGPRSPRPSPSSGPRPRISSLLLVGVAGLLAAISAGAAGTPAEQVPDSRWGDPPQMRPHAIIGDTTEWGGTFTPREEHPVWHAAQVVGDLLFSATGKGLQVHGLGGSADGDPAAPKLLGYGFAPDIAPNWFQSDLKLYIYDVAVSPGNPRVAATSGAGQGVLIWDLSNLSNVGIHYQDYSHGQTINSVWAARLAGRDYAFVAAGEHGVTRYDLTAATQENGCDTATGCGAGVYQGAIQTSSDAGALDGAGEFLAVKTGREIELWKVTKPNSPELIYRADPGSGYLDVALWKTPAGKYYLALLDTFLQDGEYFTHIHEVTCVTTRSCSNARPFASPVASLSSGGDFMALLTASQSGGRTHLYVGSKNRFSGGDQREFLWDVTNPAEPVELTPDNPPGEGYWGWYYAGNDTGFTGIAPMGAVVKDGYLYRAARNLFDVHELLGASPPVADFSWSPGTVYAGETVQFTDQSSGAPTAWDWTFVGASANPTSSTQKNPTVTFGSPDDATVSLRAANDAGFGETTSKTLTVLDPAPSVGSASASPSNALVCQQVSFEANDVQGRPELSVSWEVKDGTGEVVATGSGNPFLWDTSDTDPGTAGDQPFGDGDYSAEATVSNDAGSATTEPPASVTLQTPPPLAIDSGPSADVQFGTVQLSAQTSGAASWTWDYGDGDVEEFFDAAEGESPVHVYSQSDVDAQCGGTPCTFTVTLTVDNCLEKPRSASVEVTIEEIDPLEIETFAAVGQCDIVRLPGGCFTAGQAVDFEVVVGGTPDTYEYDWKGDGTWEESPTLVTSHTYDEPGTYLPKIRIKRGTEPAVTAENGTGECPSRVECTSGEITVEPEVPASISISGPFSGTVGQSLSFSASTSNCSPSEGGWSWSASGGGSVNSSGSSASVSWGSPGPKSVSVENSACGSAKGTKSVSITTGGTDGGGGNDGGGSSDLTAGFTHSPSGPTVGDVVTFDASPSTGSPTGYSWSFGDGSSGTGKTADHAFSEPGTYDVTLSVSAPGDCKSQVGGLQGTCTDSETKSITVQAGNAVIAQFAHDQQCGEGGVGGAFCVVPTGQEITFTDSSTGKVKARTWDFGDGTTKTGKRVTHAWSEPGTFKVVLTVENGESSDSTRQTFLVEGDPVSQVEAVVVPWIAQAGQGTALPQSSDLDVHNTGDDALRLRVTFRKRGRPDAEPPSAEVTIPPLATRHFPNALKNFLGVDENLSGFLYIEVLQGSGRPVVSSVNRTFADDGRIFGQVVPGFSLTTLPAAAEDGSSRTLHLVGLNDTPERLSYFGITNPANAPLFFHLRFYDKFGQITGETEEPEVIARLGQRQYQIEQLRERFGITDLDDFRVEIVPEEGSPTPFVYAANLRLVSKDPSFLRVGRTDLDDVFLLGALNTPGLNDSLFRSDVVLGNVDGGPAECSLTFTPTGVRSDPTDPMTKSLPPGETLRVENVVSEWNVGNSVGVLRVRCDGENGVAPVVQGESYDVSRPPELYGQFMPALTAERVARPGSPHSLVGLRQDDESRTTLWLYNPSEEDVARYTVRYLDLQGNELGGEDGRFLGPGKFRQINPGFHPEEVDGDFVVRVEVSRGAMLTAAQVVNEANDPAYVIGQ